MKVKDLQEVLNQYMDNTEIYVRYEGYGVEVEYEDTFKIKDIEEEYSELILSI